jgi:hypothetical protein
MNLKSCTLLACVGGLALAQNARADAVPPSDDTPSPTEASPDTTPPPPPTTKTTPAAAPAYDANASPQVYTSQPTYYPEEESGPYSYAWSEPGMVSQVGVGLSIGGGISGFTDRAMRDTTSSDVGGLWDFRASIGTHIPIGLDIAYVGTAADINTFAGSPNGTLVGTTVEGALRYNILPHYMVNPYVFAGLGWQRYDVTNVKFSTADSGLLKHDNLAEVPLGAGVSLRDPTGFMFDLRGTFRAATNSNLLIDPRTGNQADLHTWEASAALGYEF